MAERSARARLTRRRFINWLLGTSMGGVLVSALYPVLRYLVPPAGAEAATNSTTLDIKPSDLSPNSGQLFRFGSRPAILIRTPDGDLRAFSAVCTHLGCTVQYRPDLSHIWCACHNGHFDLRGINVDGPPPRPLDRYTVNLRGDRIVVSKES